MFTISGPTGPCRLVHPWVGPESSRSMQIKRACTSRGAPDVMTLAALAHGFTSGTRFHQCGARLQEIVVTTQ
eukprot:scaffold109093_cov33-Phaeocystis_antarctica.AAC.1